ncbi:glycosyltransferase family 4 protein [Litoribacter ruber]|uniref:glycosyltransferase family 4 protein n=1 Tax=Litoribacter ruber TaxID=702568 RepID=UPI001FE470D9|nr:glycosyltransferase family 4 protein [Litoribacter alkaliphilus]
MDFGGVEQVLANSIPGLSMLPNIEVCLIVLGKGGRVEQQLVEQGIQVKVLNQYPKIPNFKLLNILRNLISKIKPDAVHCQGAEANFHGLLAARIAGVPLRIGEEIGFPNHHSYWKYIFKTVYKNATKVIAISQAVKERIVELGEVESEKMVVVYNPVDLSNSEKIKNPSQKISVGDKDLIGLSHEEETLRFPQSDIFKNVKEGDKPFVFVTTCRLVPVKNLERLINAFAKLSQESFGKSMKLWIVGDGPLKESLEHQTQDLGISEKVKFWGFQENVFQFLKSADVFVLPSLSEGSSVSLVEAMSIGLPSIVTKIGGTTEILGESYSGILIDPVDEDSIFRALFISVSFSDEKRINLGEKAQEESKRFSVENYLEKLLSVYSF